MSRFIIVTVVVFIEVSVEFRYKRIFSAHHFDHSGNILKNTKQISPF